MRHSLPALLLFLTACATTQATPAVQSWQEVATQEDRERLREWRTAFSRAIEQARAAGNAADIEREGALLQPDAAIGGPIPNGDYRCRVIKLGTKSEGLLNYVAYPEFRCRVSQQGPVQHFDKLTGSQRPHGTIYPADQLRQVMLGTMVLGDETRAYQYGRDAGRDLAGWVEKIGDNRWRIVMPYPRFESTLDVMELAPVN
jgi:hypothetical protein